MAIAENIARVRERMAAACARAGRSTDSVALMGVSKTHGVEAVAEAYAAGLRVFGENRVQEFQQKMAGARFEGANFHLIGALQSNKTAKAAELFDAVDTVDSVKLAQRLNAAAAAAGKVLPVLVEVKLSSEESKHGMAPGAVSEILHAAGSLPALAVRGLMTVPPYFEDAEEARPYFVQLRELRDALAGVHRECPLPELSMGMSHDFEVAIEEGSTCVRVGTAIFGSRSYAE